MNIKSNKATQVPSYDKYVTEIIGGLWQWRPLTYSIGEYIQLARDIKNWIEKKEKMLNHYSWYLKNCAKIVKKYYQTEISDTEMVAFGLESLIESLSIFSDRKNGATSYTIWSILEGMFNSIILQNPALEMPTRVIEYKNKEQHARKSSRKNQQTAATSETIIENLAPTAIVSLQEESDQNNGNTKNDLPSLVAEWVWPWADNDDEVDPLTYITYTEDDIKDENRNRPFKYNINNIIQNIVDKHLREKWDESLPAELLKWIAGNARNRFVENNLEKYQDVKDAGADEETGDFLFDACAYINNAIEKNHKPTFISLPGLRYVNWELVSYRLLEILLPPRDYAKVA